MLGARFDAVVFILSTGRTGTTALAKYFNEAYPQVKAVHEPRPSWRLRLASNRYVCGRLGKKEMIRRLYSSRRALLAKVREPVYIESNPYLHGFLDVLGEVFANPRIVHLVRDPRSFIRSAVNFGSLRGVKRFLSGMLPYWSVRPEDYSDNCDRRRSKMTEIEWLAWYWTMTNRRLNAGASRYGERYIRVAFEHVFAPSGSGMSELTRWLGLGNKRSAMRDMLQDKVNPSRREVLGPWEGWPAEAKDAVRRHCAELADLYGYALD